MAKQGGIYQNFHVYRYGKLLGEFGVYQELRLVNGTLMAYSNGLAVGSVACGPGLTWEGEMLPEALQRIRRKLKRAVRGPKEAKRQAKVAEKAKSFWDVV